MNRKRKSRKRRWLGAIAFALIIVSSLQALSHNEVREPVVRFIDFYVAAQKAEAPMTLWEKIMYALAAARGASHQPTQTAAR